MNPFLSREQKHPEENADLGHASLHQNKDQSSLFSKPKKVLSFAAAVSFCLLLVGIGIVRAFAFDEATPASEQAGAPLNNLNNTGGAAVRQNVEARSQQSSAHEADIFVDGTGAETTGRTQVTVNGRTLPVLKDGRLHETIKQDGGETNVNIEVQRESSGNHSSSSSSVRVESRSSSINARKEDGG